MRGASGLARLERIARLKADLELRRFAAFRAHVARLDATLTAIDADLAALRGGGTGDGAPAAGPPLAAARFAAALARQAALERHATQAERSRLTPPFEAARRDAVRAFGRAEALAELGRRSAASARDAATTRAAREAGRG